MHDLTLEKAAQRLGLTPERLSEFASDGDVPHSLLTRRGWLFRSDTIEVLAAAGGPPARWPVRLGRDSHPRGTR